MNTDYFTHGEKEFLLKLARTTLEKNLRDDEQYEPQTVNQKLWEKYGVFVSLYKDGKVIGQAGLDVPDESVIIAVRNGVVEAIRGANLSSMDTSDLGDIEIKLVVKDAEGEVEFAESSFRG